MQQNKLDLWQKVGGAVLVEMTRPGWRGVWDAIVAAITNRPRHTATHELTLTLWLQTNGDAEAYINVANEQVELRPVDEPINGKTICARSLSYFR